MSPAPLPSITILINTVSAVKTIRFLRFIISLGHKWMSNICTINTLAQEVQPASGAADQVLLHNNTVFSLYIPHCVVWISHQKEQNILQQKVRTAERIICASLPSIQDAHTFKVRTQTGSITVDPPQHGHNLFQLLLLQSTVCQNNQTRQHLFHRP